MLHEKATDIQQVSRQTRKQDTNIVSLKVLLEWVYDWPVVYWLQLIISKQSFRNSVTGSLFCFEIVNVLDRWMCKGVFDGYPQSKLVYVYFLTTASGRKGEQGERDNREKGGKERQGHKGERETGKGRGSVTPFGSLRTYNANLPADAAWQAVARRAPRPTPFRLYIFNSPNGVRFPMVIS